MKLINTYENTWITLINEICELEKRISNYLEFPDNENEAEIKEEYKRLKEKSKEISHQIQLSKYDKFKKNDNKFATFASNIKEASAFGFTESINARVTNKMFSAVEEASYKLNKHVLIKNGQIEI